MTTEEMIKVMQAFVDGKKIEFMSVEDIGCDGDIWEEIEGASPSWNWAAFIYRIKPEVVTKEMWLNPEYGNMVRVDENDCESQMMKAGWKKVIVTYTQP